MGLRPQEVAVRDWVKTQVSPRRFAHIQGVARSAEALARRHGQSVEKCRLAAWLHDAAKEYTRARMLQCLKGSPFRLDPLEQKMPGLWHPHAGAALALKRWKIKDREVLEAIRCHTLGGEKMGPVAQVVFVADFIEPGRAFKGLVRARRAARESLVKGVRAKAEMTLGHLLQAGHLIHPRLVLTYNAFLEKDFK
ncbi:MAG TPA: bis(5'-nucleosyl)-tetraphosphatase (symmetrical) YqeK [bacterium]|nr:bis(5'-nucleosyl)-tetraphosphatase (symmetrical) YqeK [bacterium]